MSRHRKIDVRMWGDSKFRALSRSKPNAQTLWIYLLTGPHTTSIPGLFSAGEAGLAEAIGWPLSGFRAAFAEIESQGMARADWDARVVWIRRAVVYNFPESPNVVKSWRPYLDEIAECPLKAEACDVLRAALADIGPAFADAFDKASGKPSGKPSGKASAKASLKPQVGSKFQGVDTPSANQEQEQEQEQEQKCGEESPHPSCPETRQASSPGPPGGDDEPKEIEPQPEGEPPIESPSVLTFPCDGPVKEWHLTQAELQQLTGFFPALDVLAECRKAMAWIIASPERKKTARGMRKFLTGWLSRSQNRGPAPAAIAARPATESIAERIARLSREKQAKESLLERASRLRSD